MLTYVVAIKKINKEFKIYLISTGALLEHFTGRAEHAALCTLAARSLPGDSTQLQMEFQDTIARLNRQPLQQRIAELQDKQRRTGLETAEKTELRELLLAVREQAIRTSSWPEYRPG